MPITGTACIRRLDSCKRIPAFKSIPIITIFICSAIISVAVSACACTNTTANTSRNFMLSKIHLFRVLIKLKLYKIISYWTLPLRTCTRGPWLNAACWIPTIKTIPIITILLCTTIISLRIRYRTCARTITDSCTNCMLLKNKNYS